MQDDSKEILLEDVWSGQCKQFPLYGVVETLDKKFVDDRLFRNFDDAEKLRHECESQMMSFVHNEYRVVKVERAAQLIVIDLPWQNGYYFFECDGEPCHASRHISKDCAAN